MDMKFRAESIVHDRLTFLTAALASSSDTKTFNSHLNYLNGEKLSTTTILKIHLFARLL